MVTGFGFRCTRRRRDGGEDCLRNDVDKGSERVVKTFCGTTPTRARGRRRQGLGDGGEDFLRNDADKGSEMVVMTRGDGVRISLHPEAERWW